MTEEPDHAVFGIHRRAVADGTISTLPMRPETGQDHPGNRPY